MKAIGVPWETIKDIIFTDVNRLYAHKARALGPALHQPYWHTDSVTAGNQETERRRKLDALEAERRAFLTELVGTESDDDARTRLGWHESTAPQLDFLSPEKRERVDALSEYDLRRDKLLQHPGGILLKDDLEEMKRLDVEKRSILEGLLTPAELDQYDLVMHSTAAAMRRDLGAFRPSEEEFRKIFAARRAIDENVEALKLRAMSDPTAPPAGLQMAEMVRRGEQQIEAALGAERYADYQRAQDPQFLVLQRVSQETGLSEDALVRAYQAKKASEQQYAELEQQVKRAGTPTPALKDWLEGREVAIQKGEEAALRQALGPKGFESYTRLNPGVGPSAPPAGAGN